MDTYPQYPFAMTMSSPLSSSISTRHILSRPIFTLNSVADLQELMILIFSLLRFSDCPRKVVNFILPTVAEIKSSSLSRFPFLLPRGFNGITSRSSSSSLSPSPLSSTVVLRLSFRPHRPFSRPPSWPLLSVDVPLRSNVPSFFEPSFSPSPAVPPFAMLVSVTHSAARAVSVLILLAVFSFPLISFVVLSNRLFFLMAT